MKASIKKNPSKAKSKLDKFSKKLEGKKDLSVGLPKDSAAYPGGTSVIMVGAVHEFGSEEAGIPERSFLRATMNSKKKVYAGMLKDIAKKTVTRGKPLSAGLNILGFQVVSDVKETIEKGIEPASQRAEAEGGVTLVDTAHLTNSIVHAIS